MSGPMVRAILAGRKKVTRRTNLKWLQVKAGDLIWVRESWQPLISDPPTSTHPDLKTGRGYYVSYPATSGRVEFVDEETCQLKDAIRPSLFMPRWASRITLRATEDARLEYLQDITEEGARHEGVYVLDIQDASHPSAWWQTGPGENQARTPRESFRKLWESIEGLNSWAANPQVVRVAFEVVE
jgi:hypothetical protein